MTLERSKVWHGNFLAVQKGRWVGLIWSAHSRERITSRSQNRSGGSSWKITFRERTEADPNIASGTAKADQDPDDIGILYYAESIR